MRLFSRRKRTGQVNQSLMLRLREELIHRFSHTQGTGYSFIHPEDAKAVLTREHVRDLLSELSWYNEDDRTRLWQSMSLILCILISMAWPDWEHFITYFYYPGKNLQHPRYTDRNLPIDPEDFFVNAPEHFSNEFLSAQHTFAPVFIKENSHLTYSNLHRLPILKAIPLPVDGAQGVVDKVTIERKFLYYANGSSNFTAQIMARKRITRTPVGKRNFDTEQRALLQFKQCIVNNQNIMQSFASFIHGSDFIILSPWANGRDLDLFLRKPDEILDDYPGRSFRFSPDNLLTEAYNLAQALNFLHFEMVTTRGKRLRCAHLDLKPQNVLVSFPPEDRATEAPVGRWKISDFGLSKVEEAVAGDRVMPVGQDDQEASLAPGNVARELSIQPTRGPGAFQPPEVRDSDKPRVSTQRDVWSYGCILAMVLAFALGGPTEVNSQCQSRAIGNDDFFYRKLDRRTRIPGSTAETTINHVHAELKPGIKRWLEHAYRLTDERHSPWIQHTANLVVALLDVNAISRPEIRLAMENLHVILERTERVAASRLWGFHDASRLPEPVIIPITPPQNHAAVTDTPLIGVLGYSPSSSASLPLSRHRSPKIGSQRSSGGSSSVFFRPDPSLSFARLLAPDNCQGATLEHYGQAAALWSKNDIRLYGLASLHGKADAWYEKPSKAPAELATSEVGGLTLPDSSACQKVQLAGQWVAVHEQLAPSAHCICLYHLSTSQALTLEMKPRINLSQIPEAFRLSAQGVLAIQFRDHIDIESHGRRAQLTLHLEYVSMAFSRNGEYFCLWERDKSKIDQAQKRDKNHARKALQYWTVWYLGGATTGTEFVRLGKTMAFGLPDWSPGKPTGEVFLIPFSTYPRFIACDRQQHLYLVRADNQDDPVHKLLESDNVVSGFMLPDDENFMLIKTSQHDRQRAEKCFMSFLGSPSLQVRSCGRIHDNINMEIDGAAVTTCNQLEGLPCLLTLKHSGRLVRKIL